jgi:hypothetical protein
VPTVQNNPRQDSRFQSGERFQWSLTFFDAYQWALEPQTASVSEAEAFVDRGGRDGPHDARLAPVVRTH